MDAHYSFGNDHAATMQKTTTPTQSRPAPQASGRLVPHVPSPGAGQCLRARLETQNRIAVSRPEPVRRLLLSLYRQFVPAVI